MEKAYARSAKRGAGTAQEEMCGTVEEWMEPHQMLRRGGAEWAVWGERKHRRKARAEEKGREIRRTRRGEKGLAPAAAAKAYPQRRVGTWNAATHLRVGAWGAKRAVGGECERRGKAHAGGKGR